MSEQMQINPIGTRQPKGLYWLFSTEVWERFGYYTIQAILILFMTKKFGYSDTKANLTYATYSALLYLTPVIGGYLADRYFGFQRAIMVGGIFSALGYVLLSFSNEILFFLGLSVLICANGLFKPNVSSILGDLYQSNDPRRDGGFTIFYMGINIGALIPPLIAEPLSNRYGWHAGFLLASSGMIIALVVFAFAKKKLSFAGQVPSRSPLLGTLIQKIRFETLFYLGLIAAVAACMLAFRFPGATTTIVEISGVLVAVFLVVLIKKEPVLDRKKIYAALMLVGISVGFWALYNQTFTSLTLFADRNMIQTFLGLPVNASTMQFFNPLFIILFSPVLSLIWIKLSKRQLNPTVPGKFAIGILFLTLGFLILPFAISFFADQGMLPAGWLVGSYLLQTIGELLISPVGLSMITVLIPKHLVGMMMGVWFFAQAASFAIGGSLANLAAIPENIPNRLASMAIYNHAFMIFGIISLALAAISFSLLPFLKRLIKDKPIVAS